MGDRDAGGTAGTCKTQQVLCTAGAYVHMWCAWVLGTHLPAWFTRVPVRGEDAAEVHLQHLVHLGSSKLMLYAIHVHGGC